jgi:hypothetical protein
MNLASAADIALVVLVAVMIGYCVVLNRRLAALHRGQVEMGKLVAAFNDAALRAESGLTAFRATGDDHLAKLDRVIERARTVGDELVFLTERGDRIAGSLAGARSANRIERDPEVPDDIARSEVERRLAQAVRARR